MGTFALEGLPKVEDCKLESPVITPNGGAFSQAKPLGAPHMSFGIW